MTTLLNHNQVKNIFSQTKLTQEAFAELLHISDRHLRNLCTRDWDVSVSLLGRLSELSGIPVQDLLISKEVDVA